MVRSEGQKQSRKHEERIASLVGGKRVKASGALWNSKGDVSSDTLLLEHKWTGKKQYTLKADELEKIYGEALLSGKIAALGIHLNGTDYVVLTEDDFLEWANRLGLIE